MYYSIIQREKAIRSIFVLLCMVFVGVKASAQTDIQLSQHMFNRTSYNPAATGASQYVNIDLDVRQQWVGWEGAPRTQRLNVHNYFESLRSGLGLVAIHDKLGFENWLNAKLAYAFHVFLTENSYLSLGMAAGIQYSFINFDKINPQDPMLPDPFTWDLTKKLSPDFDFGMEYNTERFTVGASATHIQRSESNGLSLEPGRHYYGYVKYKFSPNPSWDITPSLFLQNSQKSTEFEANVLAMVNDKFWLGASFRMDDKATPESVVGMVGFAISNSFQIGYSYDYNLSALRGNTGGAHEVLAIIRLAKREHSYSRTPRFFE